MYPKQLSSNTTELYQNLFNEATVPMLIISPETGQIVSANRAAEAYYGYSKGLTQFNIMALNQLSPQEIKQEMSRAKSCKRNYFIFKHKLANGNIRDVEVFSSPIQVQNQPLLFSVIHDITDRIKAEQEINLYAQVFTASTDMLAVIDDKHAYLAANQSYLKLVNKTHKQVIGAFTRDIIGEHAYHDYLPHYKRAMQGEVVVFERLFYDANRSKRDIEVRYFPFYSRSGKQAGVVAVQRDITERKSIEEELRLSATVYQSTVEGVIISDNKNKIVDVNQAFINMTGYQKQNLIGLPTLSLFTRQAPATFDIDSVHHTLEQDLSWRGELVTQCKDGSLLPIWATINAVTTGNNTPERYVSVIRDMSFYKRTSERLEFLAHHDNLTHLPNRLLLSARLEQSLNRAKRSQSRLAVAFIDLDRFKNINDSLGHSAGDALLVAVAGRLKDCIREEDTIARVSGDEFVAILENTTSSQDVETATQRLSAAFATPFYIEKHALFVTASIGVSLYPNDGQTPSQLIHNADTAMYKSKQQGRNQSALFSELSTQDIEEQNVIENALRGALNRNEFSLVFQPQMDLNHATCLGIEVLLRWRHPELGQVSPAVFIPLAEQLGLIWDIGNWVLHQACEQGKAWHDLGLDFGRIAVNVAGMQLRHGRFNQIVEQAITKTGFTPHALELEITEDFVMSKADEHIKQLAQLQAMGIEIAIDDFGTGYSSLNYLKKLPITKLKIDRSFVFDLVQDTDSQVIIASIIALANAMNLSVIAEGVETFEQAKILSQNGCHQAQGYLYSKPITAAEMQHWLSKATVI
ncbi:EAL domain-containing protein [Shewanella gelidii]|uniref:cyclic-guanylate-specific phosphodiesterase n=1 Tax=Shewanella gelidii TaxID=1642821 RepID=A0A917JS49_9GAMM|nr:EAL domain-containing protein [Shewanella gelidii]MCL1098212.1 EAL domain-containing protein [Shewanella gelidii]GGI83435.1 GGDEF domain-containing protein [Shewanella gelidii]